jgi:hypothetical protein
MVESSFSYRRNLYPTIASEPSKRRRLPQALEDKAPNTLGVEDIEFINIGR